MKVILLFPAIGPEFRADEGDAVDLPTEQGWQLVDSGQAVQHPDDVTPRKPKAQSVKTGE